MDLKLQTAHGGGAGPGTACGEQGGELEQLPFRAFELFSGVPCSWARCIPLLRHLTISYSQWKMHITRLNYVE